MNRSELYKNIKPVNIIAELMLNPYENCVEHALYVLSFAFDVNWKDVYNRIYKGDHTVLRVFANYPPGNYSAIVQEKQTDKSYKKFVDNLLSI
jgi:hypothetical protein